MTTKVLDYSNGLTLETKVKVKKCHTMWYLMYVGIFVIKTCTLIDPILVGISGYIIVIP